MKKNLNLNEIEALSRDEAKQYCDKYKLEYRSKDDTNKLKRVIKAFLGLTETKTQPKTKVEVSSKKTSAPKTSSKEVEVKKEVKTTSSKSTKSTKNTTSSKPDPKSSTDLPSVLMRILGLNVLLTINEVVTTIKITDKDKREELKELVKKYQTKPSKTLLASINKFIPKVDKTKKVIEVEKPVKKVSPKVEDKIKEASPKETAPVNKPTERRGEY